MPTRKPKEHEVRIRRMVATGRYDADFGKRLDEIYREWNLGTRVKSPAKAKVEKQVRPQ
jgi:hypothetical protein